MGQLAEAAALLAPGVVGEGGESMEGTKDDDDDDDNWSTPLEPSLRRKRASCSSGGSTHDTTRLRASAASSRASARDAEAPPARAPHAHAAGEPLEAEGRAEAREQITLLQKLHRAAPELNRYHVLLIPKDVESEDVSTNRE